VAAGILAGSAAGVKYLGLYIIAAAAILIVRRAAWRAVLRDLAINSGAAAVALLPTNGRLVWHTGNPRFPVYPELVVPSPSSEPTLIGAQGADRWALAITRLWDVTFRRHLIGNLPPFSPAFVFSLPLIAFGAWRLRHLRSLFLIALGFVLLATTHAHHL